MADCLHLEVLFRLDITLIKVSRVDLCLELRQLFLDTNDLRRKVLSDSGIPAAVLRLIQTLTRIPTHRQLNRNLLFGM
jgi:hypothetical protein